MRWKSLLTLQDNNNAMHSKPTRYDLQTSMGRFVTTKPRDSYLKEVGFSGEFDRVLFAPRIEDSWLKSTALSLNDPAIAVTLGQDYKRLYQVPKTDRARLAKFIAEKMFGTSDAGKIADELEAAALAEEVYVGSKQLVLS